MKRSKKRQDDEFIKKLRELGLENHADSIIFIRDTIFAEGDRTIVVQTRLSTEAWQLVEIYTELEKRLKDAVYKNIEKDELGLISIVFMVGGING